MLLARPVFITLIVAAAFANEGFAQISAGGTPPSFTLSLSSANVPTATMAPVDNAALLAEDAAQYEQARQAGVVPPHRIARPHEVNLNLNQSGTWETLPNGDRIWRLRIVSPGATDIYMQYDHWRLVKPCELWLYNDDRSMILGPYTYIDNWDGTNITPLTRGEAVTLEYHVPVGVEDQGELSIMRVLHGYRQFMFRHSGNRDPLDAFGDSMPCMINVRCFPEWQNEKLSVALILDPMGGACTGTMLNNVPQDGAPNFLTANHCLGTNWGNWLFYFNYESPQCNPNQEGSYAHVISNASLLASHASSPGSDFALLRLARNRPNSPFIPRYEGWDRHNIPPPTSIGIHHPAADVKKIHYDTSPAEEHPENSHWVTHIDLGMMEPGSSGSALFDANHRVVGQLQGGTWDCDAGTINEADYGKFSMSWDFGGDPTSRLREHLDPYNTGAWEVNAFQPVGPPNDSCGDFGENIPIITSVPYSHSGSTQWAADNYPGGCATNTAPDVFYSLRMNCDYQITVSTCGSNFDTQIRVTNAACSEYGLFVDCNDDFCGTQSQLTFTAEAGEPYTIMIDGYASAWGNYVFNVTGFATGGPPNAQCPGNTITTVPFFENTANYCGGDNWTPSCQSFDSEDIVYNWLSPYNQLMRAKTCLTDFDTILEVMQGGGCPGSTSVGCNDDNLCAGDPFASQVSFYAYSGVPYYFHVDGYNGALGFTNFELEVANDNCSSPIIMTGVPWNSFGDTRPARDDFATVIGPASKEVFFQYTSTACQNLGFTTCGLNGYDTAIEVRTGGSCPGSTIVTYNDDACGLQSTVLWGAEANRTYYIIVGGYSTSEGPFSYQLYTYPNPLPYLADVCPGILIPSLPFTDYGNTACMANNYTNCVYQPNYSREMVYYFSRPQCEIVTVSACGSGYDTGLGVYGGVCPNISPLIVCNDDNYCGQTFTLQSTVSFQAEANTNYQILVHGYSTNYGPYVINVSSTPCAVAPNPVTDLVIQINSANGDVILNWTATQYADVYDVYRASDSQTLFNAGNIIATMPGATYLCAGCVNDASLRSFFGVVAVNQAAPASVSPENPDLTKTDAMRVTLEHVPVKAAAVQGEVILNPAFNPPLINVEITPPGKAVPTH